VAQPLSRPGHLALHVTWVNDDELVGASVRELEIVLAPIGAESSGDGVVPS
jgi:hypothetical protein